VPQRRDRHHEQIYTASRYVQSFGYCTLVARSQVSQNRGRLRPRLPSFVRRPQRQPSGERDERLRRLAHPMERGAREACSESPPGVAVAVCRIRFPAPLAPIAALRGDRGFAVFAGPPTFTEASLTRSKHKFKITVTGHQDRSLGKEPGHE